MTPVSTTRHPASVTRVAAQDRRRSWETSHLPPLSGEALDALIDIMPAWLAQREWRPPEGGDLKLLWEYADRHGLGGALGALAAKDLVPAGELAELAKRRYFSNMVHCERAQRTVGKLLAAARGLDLPIVVFKGPSLAQQAYGDEGVRAFSDIDLWVPSRADALRLLDAVQSSAAADSDREGLIRRIRAPRSMVAVVDGWDVEIRYPGAAPTDPMLELLGRSEPAAGRGGVPDPSWHLLLLVLHMSWYHYFSRFVWFLDVAALVSRCRAQIDFEWILREAGRLQAANLVAVTGRFCRENIDPSFPELPTDRSAWNYRFLCLASAPRTVARGRFSLHQRTWRRMSYILWFRIMRHFLLSDPPRRYLPDHPPKSWMIATLLNGVRSAGFPARTAARALVGILVYPLARLSAWITTMSGLRGRFQ